MDISSLYGSSTASSVESLFDRQTAKQENQETGAASSWGGKDTVSISSEALALAALDGGNSGEGERQSAGGDSGTSSGGGSGGGSSNSNDSRIESLKGRLSALQGKLGQAGGDDSSVNAEIAALQGEIAALEAQ